MNKYLFTRKHDGKMFDFYLNESIYGKYISVETELNSFGYPDTILLSSGDIFKHKRKAYTLYRYQPAWILEKLTKQMLEAEKNI